MDSVPSFNGFLLLSDSSLARALANGSGFLIKRAEVSSAIYSLALEIASWISIAAIGARIQISIKPIMLPPLLSSSPPNAVKYAIDDRYEIVVAIVAAIVWIKMSRFFIWLIFGF